MVGYWISIKDGLPKEKELVLVYVDQKYREEFTFGMLLKGKMQGYYHEFDYTLEPMNITHWMRLYLPTALGYENAFRDKVKVEE